MEEQTTKRKKRKMTKDDSYVDERITHPQFGISKFSLKDPLGTLFDSPAFQKESYKFSLIPLLVTTFFQNYFVSFF